MTRSARCYLFCFVLAGMLGLAGCGDNPPPPPPPAPIVVPTPVVEPTIPKPIDNGSTDPAPSTTDATLPFSIELGEPFTIEGAPGLHSFSQAVSTSEGSTKWLFVGGRTGGLHTFVAPNKANPANAFADDTANLNLIVIDIENRAVKSVLIDTLAKLDPPLPAAINTWPWKSSSAQACQVGDKLYLVGGYGHSPDADTAGKMMTFGTLTRMNVSDVIDAVWNQKSIANSVAQITDSRFKITGGEMLPFGSAAAGQSLAVVFGQLFDGLYSVDIEKTDGVFQQKYWEIVKSFTITDDPLAIAKDKSQKEIFASLPNSFVAKPTPDTIDGFAYADFLKQRPYHRRDLNVFPALSPTGLPRIGVYGGVFQPGRFDGYLQPIYIDEVATISYEREGVSLSYQTFSPGTDHQFEQLLSQYHCAGLPVHDLATGQMVTIFFGGISNFRYDTQQNQLIKDKLKLAANGRPIVDGLPFDKAVSALVHRNDKTSAGFVLPITMSGYLGAEAELLINPSVPRSNNGVILLDKIT